MPTRRRLTYRSSRPKCSKRSRPIRSGASRNCSTGSRTLTSLRNRAFNGWSRRWRRSVVEWTVRPIPRNPFGVGFLALTGTRRLMPCQLSAVRTHSPSRRPPQGARCRVHPVRVPMDELPAHARAERQEHCSDVGHVSREFGCSFEPCQCRLAGTGSYLGDGDDIDLRVASSTDVSTVAFAGRRR